jgi:type II secretory pathway pseudopilin PulG
MTGWSTSDRRGFTFVEILAAMLFMAIVLPVVMDGLQVANRAGQAAERTRIAQQLANRQLTELVLTGQWEKGEQSGDFGTDYPGFTWSFKSEAWSVKTSLMNQVSVTVQFKLQERPYEVRVCSLVGKASS